MTSTFHELISHVLEGVDTEVVERFITLINAIWEAHNALLFKNR